MNFTISRKKILLVRLLFVCNTAVNGLSSIYFCNQLFVRGGGASKIGEIHKKYTLYSMSQKNTCILHIHVHVYKVLY